MGGTPGNRAQTVHVGAETHVTLKIDSGSLFDALRKQLGEWRLSEYRFRPEADEVAMSYDSGGAGRVALTVVFELDELQMARLLQDARPAR